MMPVAPRSGSPMPDSACPDDPRDAAAWWFSRQHSGQFSSGDKAALARWRAADPRHEHEWQALAYLWQASAALPRSTLVAMLAEAERAAPDHSTEPGTAARTEPVRAARPRSGGGRGAAWPGSWGLAAALTLIVACLVVYLNHPQYTARFATARGEVRSETLPDGSVLTLNTDSEAEVRYYPGRRSIKLASGEALFEVAHRDHEAFFVAAGPASIRVTGTVFAVRRLEDGARIAVQRGAVELREGQWWELWQAPTRLAAGQGSELLGGRFAPTAAVNVDRLTAWRQGKLAFSNQPLAQVIDEMNRYLPQPIHLDDPSLGERRVSGIFKLGNADDFRKAVQASLPVSFRPRSDGGLDLLPR